MSTGKDQAEVDGLIFDPQGRWWRGANLDLASIRAGLTLPSRVSLMDTTLREGEETPGIYLSQDEKIRLAIALDEIGFTELEVGYAGAMDEHYELVKKLKKNNVVQAKIASHTRTYAKDGEWQEEIDRSIDAGCDILTFVGFGSKAMLKSVPWLEEDELEDRFAACVDRTCSQGIMATFSLAGSDLFRTPLTKAGSYYLAAVEAGAARVYVSDGTGGATPEAVKFYTRYLRDIVGPKPKIALHLHNTFGLATANALAGVSAGAEVVDTCMLGLGDGAGITAAEEFALAAMVFYDIQIDINLERITSLCQLVKEIFSIPLSPHKPFVGENIYRHQIDSHFAAILRNGWHTWEVVSAEALGRNRKLELAYGKLRKGRSGAIAAKLDQLGLEASDQQFNEIFEIIREIVETNKFASESEIETSIQQVISN